MLNINRAWSAIRYKLSDTVQLRAPLSEGSFVRVEDKYLLTREQADKLIVLMKTHLHNASPVPDTDFTIIESVYYDNKDLHVLKEYLDQRTSRSKLRTRRYAPNGNWSSDIFLELKTKVDGISRKSRLQISENDQDHLSNGNSLINTADLQSLNSNIQSSKLEKRINHVNVFLEKLKTVPTCKVVYSRMAYERDNFRVTLDKDLKFSNLQQVTNETSDKISSSSRSVSIMRQAQKELSKRPYILEVKHSGDIPKWMLVFLTENKISEVSFSKYCYCMSYAVAGSLVEKVEPLTLGQSLKVFFTLSGINFSVQREAKKRR